MHKPYLECFVCTHAPRWEIDREEHLRRKNCAANPWCIYGFSKCNKRTPIHKSLQMSFQMNTH